MNFGETSEGHQALHCRLPLVGTASLAPMSEPFFVFVFLVYCELQPTVRPAKLKGGGGGPAIQVRLRSASSMPSPMTACTMAWHVFIIAGCDLSAASASCLPPPSPRHHLPCLSAIHQPKENCTTRASATLVSTRLPRGHAGGLVQPCLKCWKARPGICKAKVGKAAAQLQASTGCLNFSLRAHDDQV